MALCLICFGCSKDNALDCFKSNGDDYTEFRDLGSFQNIEVYDKIELFIVNGADYKIEVIAGKHIIRNISTKVKDDVLVIENKNTCNFVRGYKRHVKVIVTVPRIKKVFNYGVADVRFDEGYTQDTLNVRAENSGDIYINGKYQEVRTSSHGNGDIYLQGSANNLLVYTNGTNYTHAENFRVSDLAYISSYSLGHAYFNLKGTATFQYYIWSEGNIYYSGNPGTIANLGNSDAKGQLIQRD